jgi:hypothetical protein
MPLVKVRCWHNRGSPTMSAFAPLSGHSGRQAGFPDFMSTRHRRGNPRRVESQKPPRVTTNKFLSASRRTVVEAVSVLMNVQMSGPDG